MELPINVNQTIMKIHMQLEEEIYNEEISMDNKTVLQDLIKSLQKSVREGGMTSKVILKATQTLKGIGYSYNHETFPPLKNTNLFKDESTDTPSNLAEALLWKLGKWNSYKKFAGQYVNDSSKPNKTDVVFYAFARHLKDTNNPIYDQHAIRAIWAICDNRLSLEEKMKCKGLLLNNKEEWKQTGTGIHAIECYSIFLKHIDEMAKAEASKREIDLLLMPLGQALKDHSKNYDEFCKLLWLGQQ